MNNNKLMLWAVVAIVLAAAAYWTSQRREQAVRPSSASGQLVLPALDDPAKLNSIASLSFESADQTVRVARADGVWVAPDRFNHPVKFDDVRKFLLMLSELKVGQGMPDDPKQLESLGLLAPGPATTNGPKKESMGTRIAAADKDGKPVATLIVGKARNRASAGGPMDMGGFPDGRYVAADGKAALVGESFSSLPAKSTDWIETLLVDVFSSDIEDLTWTPAGQPAIRLKNDNGELKLADLGAKEKMESSKVSNLSGALSYLRFSDVADPALPAEKTGFDKPSVLVAKQKNGKRYTLTIGGPGPTNSLRYVKAAVAFEPPPEPAKPAATNAPAPAAASTNAPDAKKADDEAAKRKAETDKLAGEVKEFNDRAGKWIYLVENYKFENLPKTRADLLQPPETNAPPAAATPAPPAAPVPAPAAAPAPVPAPPAAAEKPAPAAAPAPAVPAPVAAADKPAPAPAEASAPKPPPAPEKPAAAPPAAGGVAK